MAEFTPEALCDCVLNVAGTTFIDIRPINTESPLLILQSLRKLLLFCDRKKDTRTKIAIC